VTRQYKFGAAPAPARLINIDPEGGIVPGVTIGIAAVTVVGAPLQSAVGKIL
jgi:siroheme synthase